LIEWAEPIIREVCQEVWREARPRGLEIEDLYQEGRIAVFQAAREIAAATDHAAMVATVVRCQALDALRLLADWDTPPQADEEDESPQAETPLAAG
jgi:DNA-directed RNA polymerase specialized sigma24 family protein